MAIFRAEYKLSGKRIILRSAEPEDAGACIELLNRLDQQTVFLLREPGEFSMTLEQERDLIASRKQSESNLMLLAEMDGRIIASAGAAYDTRKRLRHAASIGIAIDQPFWGIGIGRAMMEELIGWLRGQHVEKINLIVDTGNTRAISLYMRYGFTVEGTQRHERKMPDGSYRDAYWMTLFL